jgi:multidrug resistance efflux pump
MAALGRLIGYGIIAGALVAVAVSIRAYDVRPQTDDATLRADFIGVAPQVSGHIVELRVHDDQPVQKGDLLFAIDPRPYEQAVARARAGLVLARKEVDAAQRMIVVADAAIVRAEAQRLAAEATVRRTEAEFKDADDHWKRVQPLLAGEFTTSDAVEDAQTHREIASAAVEEAQKSLAVAIAGIDQARAERLRAEDDVGQEKDFNARIANAEAELSEAELDLGYCRVAAPFNGKIVNLNISVGEFARAGVDVFTLVNTGTWYVVANFRETQLRHIAQGGLAEVYVPSLGASRYKGHVVGLAWAVVPEDGTSAIGLPAVPRNLDWVRLAQRFPVRIQLDNPDDSFRLGASAVVTVTGKAAR